MGVEVRAEAQGKIEPGVLGLVSKYVFVEVCLRMSRNIMSQVRTEE